MDTDCCTWTEGFGKKCGGTLVPVGSLEKDRTVVDFVCMKCGRIGSLAQLILERVQPKPSESHV